VPTPIRSNRDLIEWVPLHSTWNVYVHHCLDPQHPVHVLFFCSRACQIDYDLRAMDSPSRLDPGVELVTDQLSIFTASGPSNVLLRVNTLIRQPATYRVVVQRVHESKESSI
jgi:hypothetical protein